jgi:predicted nucleic acid-binding protein
VKYLVDANVLSEVTKSHPSVQVTDWLRQNEPDLKDSLIAATALVHDLTVATRNARDFQKAGVRIHDPFQ